MRTERDISSGKTKCWGKRSLQWKKRQKKGKAWDDMTCKRYAITLSTMRRKRHGKQMRLSLSLYIYLSLSLSTYSCGTCANTGRHGVRSVARMDDAPSMVWHQRMRHTVISRHFWPRGKTRRERWRQTPNGYFKGRTNIFVLGRFRRLESSPTH